MTTDTNTMLNSMKEAFAPVTDAMKNFQSLEVPEAAREFVKKTAGTAKDRAADLHAGSAPRRALCSLRRDGVRRARAARWRRKSPPAGARA